MTNLAQLLKEAEDDMQKKVRSTRPKEGEVSYKEKITGGMGGGGGAESEGQPPHQSGEKQPNHVLTKMVFGVE